MNVTANLGPRARTRDGRNLPPFGFFAEAPGMVAANLRRLGTRDFGEEGVSFVVEGDARKADVWVYASSAAPVAITPPAGMDGKVRVAWDDTTSHSATVQDGVLALRTPARGASPAQPPPELADKAPRDWPGARPVIGILDFGPGFPSSWVKASPEEWATAFQRSPLATQFGLPIGQITSVDTLIVALQSGPERCLAIINPYGETLPSRTGPLAADARPDSPLCR